MTVKFLRPMQELSPEVRDGTRQPGELVFPDCYVLPPGEPFTATIVETKIVWNEWRLRDFGGGLIAQHPHRVQTINELVETGLITVDTLHGRATISVVYDQFLMMRTVIAVKKLIGKSVKFQLWRFGIVVAGNSAGSVWFWKTPVHEGDAK